MRRCEIAAVKSRGAQPAPELAAHKPAARKPPGKKRRSMPMHSPPPGEAAAEDSENYFLLDTSRLEEGFEEIVDDIVPTASSSRRLLVFADVLGIGAFVLLWADPAEPIDLFRWVAATLSFALVFALLACVQLTRLGFHIHLHAGGFLYCAIIHAGLHLHRHPPEAQTVDDSLANWPLMLFVTPLMWAFGASAALRDQPGLPSLDLRSLLFGGGGAAAPTAARRRRRRLPAGGGAARRRAAERARAQLCGYFVPFWLGTLPNFAAKAKLLPDFRSRCARWRGGARAVRRGRRRRGDGRPPLRVPPAPRVPR